MSIDQSQLDLAEIALSGETAQKIKPYAGAYGDIATSNESTFTSDGPNILDREST